MLTLTINERDITMSNRQTFRKGTVGAKCKIVFTDFWSKYNKTIVFKPTSKFIGGPFVVYATDMEIEVTIPWEVMSEVGSFRIGVYGTADDEVLPTLWSEYNEVEDATDTSGEAPQDPSPSVYQQILELTTEAVNISNSVREDANAGKFKGDKGDPGKDAVTDQIYNPESENAQSGKAVAEAVSGCVPKKIANSGAPFSSVLATNNEGLGEHNLPTDDSYMCIDTIGAELGKNMDNYLYVFAGSIPRRDSNGNLFTGTPIDDEDCINKKYVDEKIPENIKDSTGKSSLQQVQDTGYTGIAIKTKNPNAYALDNTLTDNEPIGATGAFASSFGGVTSAQGKRSFACGTNTIAKGKYSFASGDNAVALGNESFVSGYNTVAKGSQSFAMGSGTQAIGQNSVSTGSNNISNGGNSFTGGQDCVTGATALRSFAYGKGLKALSNDAFVVGKFNQGGDELFEVGNGTSDTNRHTAFKISNDGEVWAEQLFTNSLRCGKVTINGTDIWVGGYRILTTNATDFMPIVNSNLNLNNGSGTYSIIQKDNIAIASGSAAFGISTQATAGASMATGVGTQANGLHSFAAGNNSIAGYANQFVVGKFNSNKSDTYFEVGNGSNNDNRSTAFAVCTDGSIRIGNTKITEAQLQKLLALIN